MTAIVPQVIASWLVTLVVVTLAAGKWAVRYVPRPDQAARLGAVDGLRGYLAWAVFLSHGSIWLSVDRFGGEWGETLPLPALGGPAVAMFFMATGLVFYPVVIRGPAVTNWPALYITRIFRIVPMTLVSVTAVLLVIMARVEALPRPEDIRPFIVWVATIAEPPLLGYRDSALVNAGVLWTLKLEWCFYFLMLPAMAIAMQAARSMGIDRRRAIIGITLATAAVTLAGRWLRIDAITWNMPYVTLFCAGMVAFECREIPRLKAFLSSGRATIPAVAALAGGVYLWTDWSSASLTSILLMFVFFAAVTAGNDIWGALSNRGAIVLGQCCFGVYLLHGIALFAVFVFANDTLASAPTRWLPFILPFVALIILAIVSWMHVAIELPFIDRGRRLARRLTGSAPRLGRPATESAP